MIRIAICEDEQKSMLALHRMLEEYEDIKGCTFEISEFFNGEKMLECEEEFQIVFLDVNMPGMNGLDVGKILWKRDKKCCVIYITNLTSGRDIAQNQVHSFAYLTKPVDKTQLFGQLDELISIIPATVEKQKGILFNTIEHGIIEKLPEEILCFEYAKRRITMYCRNGSYQIKGNIGDYEQLMKEFNFATPYKGCVVNLQYVSKIRTNDILMIDGREIPLSQKRTKVFRQTFADYIQRRGN